MNLSPAKPSLFLDQKFWPLFYTQFFGAFNDNFFKNALVILITFQTTYRLPLPAEQLVALCGGIFIFPFFLFSAFSGQIADKYEKSQLTRWIKIFEITAMAIACIGFYFHLIYLLLFVLFLMGLHSTLFGPIKYSYLPQLLSSENELFACNAWFQSGTFIAILLGTIGGGVSIALSQNAALYTGIFAVSFAIIGYFFSRYILPISPKDQSLVLCWNPFRSTKDLLTAIFKEKNILLPILGISWFWFFGAAVLSLFPPFGKKILHGNEHVVTFLLAIFSIGIGIGSFFCNVFSHTKIKPWLSLIGCLGMSVFTIDIYFSVPNDIFPEASPVFQELNQFLINPSSWRTILDLFLLSVFGGFFIIPLVTKIQKTMDPAKLARAIAANNILNALAMVLASVLLIVLFAMGYKIPTVFFILGCCNFVIALYLFFFREISS